MLLCRSENDKSAGDIGMSRREGHSPGGVSSTAISNPILLTATSRPNTRKQTARHTAITTTSIGPKTRINALADAGANTSRGTWPRPPRKTCCEPDGRSRLPQPDLNACAGRSVRQAFAEAFARDDGIQRTRRAHIRNSPIVRAVSRPRSRCAHRSGDDRRRDSEARVPEPQGSASRLSIASG
jgi:hypothetical protein